MIEINIHTHYLEMDNTFQIINYLAHNLPVAENKNLYSVGVHPWHLTNVDTEWCLQEMEQALTQKNVVAVGECGLDRAIETDFAVQGNVFIKQIELAQKYSKPLIIHCVRAFPELIKLKKEYPSPLPWIIHGFQGNQQTKMELVKHGFYFSLGEGILRKPQKEETVAMIPLNRLFFETDDSNQPISEIYSLAAKILNIETDVLRDLVLDNLISIFPNNSVVTEKINTLQEH